MPAFPGRFGRRKSRRVSALGRGKVAWDVWGRRTVRTLPAKTSEIASRTRATPFLSASGASFSLPILHSSSGLRLRRPEQRGTGLSTAERRGPRRPRTSFNEVTCPYTVVSPTVLGKLLERTQRDAEERTAHRGAPETEETSDQFQRRNLPVYCCISHSPGASCLRGRRGGDERRLISAFLCTLPRNSNQIVGEIAFHAGVAVFSGRGARL